MRFAFRANRGFDFKNFRERTLKRSNKNSMKPQKYKSAETYSCAHQCDQPSCISNGPRKLKSFTLGNTY